MAYSNLTPKQEAFCRWYVSDECFGNATKAAKAAGYGGDDRTLGVQGNRLLKQDKIASTVRALQKKAEKQSPTTIDQVLRDLKRIASKAEEAEQWAAALRAVELQGKHLAMFTDRVEHIRSLDEISTSELLAIARELGGKIDPKENKAVLDALMRSEDEPEAAKAVEE